MCVCAYVRACVCGVCVCTRAHVCVWCVCTYVCACVCVRMCVCVCLELVSHSLKVEIKTHDSESRGQEEAQ